MYHAACKVEFQPFKRSYSQLTFFNFLKIKNYRGVAFLSHGAPIITDVVHLQSCKESGLLLLTLLRAGTERFVPSASGSSAAGLKPCGEPTCKFKSQLVTSVHQCPCGRPMHDKAIFVAHKNHSIEHNRVISNHSRTPLSYLYEDVVQQHQSFRSTAVVQRLGGRGEVDFHYQKKRRNFRPPAAVW